MVRKIRSGKKDNILVENSSNTDIDDELDIIDIDEIFNKIAPYLSNPNKIYDFLKKHLKKIRKDLIKVIEEELEKSEQINRTDLRILLNSL